MNRKEYKQKYWGVRENKPPYTEGFLKGAIRHPILKDLLWDKKIVKITIMNPFDKKRSEGGRRGTFWESIKEEALNVPIVNNMDRFKEKYKYKGIWKDN